MATTTIEPLRVGDRGVVTQGGSSYPATVIAIARTYCTVQRDKDVVFGLTLRTHRVTGWCDPVSKYGSRPRFVRDAHRLTRRNRTP